MGNYNYPKALMTVKELIEVGYPREILLEMANMQGAKSVIKRGVGGKIWFQTNLIEDDLVEWRRVNCK